MEVILLRLYLPSVNQYRPQPPQWHMLKMYENRWTSWVLTNPSKSIIYIITVLKHWQRDTDFSLQWRHNERDGAPNHTPHDVSIWWRHHEKQVGFLFSLRTELLYISWHMGSVFFVLHVTLVGWSVYPDFKGAMMASSNGNIFRVKNIYFSSQDVSLLMRVKNCLILMCSNFPTKNHYWKPIFTVVQKGHHCINFSLHYMNFDLCEKKWLCIHNYLACIHN